MLRCPSILALSFALVLHTPDALAQPSDTTATADVLFDEAKELIARGEISKACAKFETSLRLDAALGTRINLADCYERLGRIASAWTTYRAAADLARVQGDPRARLASDRAARLESRIPKLRIELEGLAPPGLTISRADAPFDLAMLGTEISADPGSTTIIAEAPGFTRFEITIQLTEGAKELVTIPPLTKTTREAPPPPPQAHPRPAPRPAEEVGGRARVWIGVGIGGGGLALVAGGLAVGVAANSAWDDAFDSGGCDRETKRCNSAGEAIADRARTRATLSTVVVAGGVVAIGVGAFLAITAPKRSHVSTHALVPTATTEGLGLAVIGAF